MNNSWIVVIILVIVAVLAAAYYFSTHAASNEQGSRVDFIGANGNTSTVYVEVADTPDKEQRGLMYRTSLDPDRGMLFIFDGDGQRSFWMQNTPLPLDMVFVNSKYEIVDINRNATPYSTTTYTAQLPCKYVVEVNGGYCDAHGIGIGDGIKINDN